MGLMASRKIRHKITSQDDIAAKLSVTLSDFYVHRIERISISRSLTDGRRKPRVIILLHHTRARSGTMIRGKSIGFEMNFSNCVGSLLAVGLFEIGLVTALAAPAHAQTRVGEAAVVKNEVLRVAGPSTIQINVGDGLVRDETVRTGTDSATRLVMADSTNLSLGPNATLKLDRTVFDDEHHYREVAIRMTSGAFRFVTGHSDKAAYKITTPLATIGVRGTTLDILSQRGQTIVNLQDGAASVCTVAFECIQLTRPGDTAIITAGGGGGRSTIKKTNNPPWTFAATCSAAARALQQNAICGRDARHRRRRQRSHRHAVRALTMANFTRNAVLSATLLVAVLAMQSSPSWAQTPSPSPSPTTAGGMRRVLPDDSHAEPIALGFANAASQRAIHQRATDNRSRFECRLDQRTG